MEWAGFWIGFGIMAAGFWIGLGMESAGVQIKRGLREWRTGGYE